MAKKIVREIVIDAQTKEAIKNMDKMGKTFEQVFETANEGIKPLTTQIGELEDAMYALAAAGETNSQEFKDLQDKVGNYKRVIIETDLQIDAMAQTTAQNLGGAIQGVSGAFAIGTGAMGTFGVESEGVNNALLKVQSALAITQGIQSVREGIKSFKGLKKAIMASTVVQRVLNVVMSANPVFLLIAAFTALAGVFSLVAGSTNKAAKQAEALKQKNEALARLAQAQEKQIKATAQARRKEIDNNLALLKSEEDVIRSKGKLNKKDEERLKNIKKIKEEQEDLKLDSAIDESYNQFGNQVKSIKGQFEEIKLVIAATDYEDGVNDVDYNSIQKKNKELQSTFEDIFAEGFTPENVDDQIKAIMALESKQTSFANRTNQAYAKMGSAEQEVFEQAKDVASGLLTNLEKLRQNAQAYKDALASKTTATQLRKDNAEIKKNTETEAERDRKRAAWSAAEEKRKNKEKEDTANRLSAERKIEDTEQEIKERQRQANLESARKANREQLEDIRNNKELEKEERLRLEELALLELRQKELEFTEEGRKLELEKANIDHQRKLKDLLDNEKLNDDEKKKLKELAATEIKQKELEINQKFDKEEDLLIEKTRKEREAKEDELEQKRIAKTEAIHQLQNELLKTEQEKELQTLIEGYDKKFEIAEGNAKLEKQLTEQLNSDIAAINKKYNDQEVADTKQKEQEKADARMAAVQGVGDALSSLGDLSQAITDAELAKAGDDEAKKERIRKKAFERDKKIQLATAIVTGIQSVMSAYQSGSAIPVIGIVMGPLMAAIAAATAAMNIKKIKNTKYESASPTTGTVPTAASAASATSTPQFNIAGNSPENQLAQTLGQDQQPVKAFVVAGDVTTAQSMERDKVELSGI